MSGACISLHFNIHMHGVLLCLENSLRIRPHVTSLTVYKLESHSQELVVYIFYKAIFPELVNEMSRNFNMFQVMLSNFIPNFLVAD